MMQKMFQKQARLRVTTWFEKNIKITFSKVVEKRLIPNFVKELVELYVSAKTYFLDFL